MGSGTDEAASLGLSLGGVCGACSRAIRRCTTADQLGVVVRVLGVLVVHREASMSARRKTRLQLERENALLGLALKVAERRLALATRFNCGAGWVVKKWSDVWVTTHDGCGRATFKRLDDAFAHVLEGLTSELKALQLREEEE